MSVALSLIALAVGYKVFVDASKEKKDVKIFGRAVGIFIIVVAFLLSLCGAIKYAYKSGCPMISKYSCPIAKMNCPLSPQAANNQ